MTLVVARRLRRTLVVCCDSKVTDRNEIERGYLTGALKAVLVDPHTCLAFAGNPYPARTALQALEAEIARHHGRAPAAEEIVELLIAIGRETGGVTHFILASLGSPRLAAIRGDDVEYSDDQLFIGDHEAVELYQRHFHEPSGQAWRLPGIDPDWLAASVRDSAAREIDELRGMRYWDEDTIQDLVMSSRMQRAMRDVIADPRATSVDDLGISVAAGPDGFRYEPSGFVYAGPDNEQVPADRPRYGSTAAGGGFMYAICVPDQPGIGAIGVHFRQGRLGALFHPLVDDAPMLYRDVDEESFRASVERARGIPLRAGVVG